jgi:DNA-directed RNA polymerase subunit beta'
MVVHVPLSLEAQAKACLLIFSRLNLLSPTIKDSICVLTQDMLMRLCINKRESSRYCANKYNPFNYRNFENKKIDTNINNNKDKYIKAKGPQLVI